MGQYSPFFGYYFYFYFTKSGLGLHESFDETISIPVLTQGRDFLWGTARAEDRPMTKGKTR